jgi:hypothetical protein
MTEDEPRRRRHRASVLLLAFFAVKLAVLLGTVDRGYEMGDEGYFLLNLAHPEAALPPFEIYRVFGALCAGCEVGVVEARLARIAAELAGSLALVGGVFVWARARVFPFGAVRFSSFLAFGLLGSLLSVASRSLGYNDLSNLACYAATGAVFHLASQPPDARRRRAAAAAVAGALVGVQLSVKFPTALLLAAVFSGVIVFGLRTLPRRERLALVGVHAGGLLAVAAAVVSLTGGAEALAARLVVASRLPALTGYDPAALLVRAGQAEIPSLFHGSVFLLVFAFAQHRARRRAPGSPDRARVRALALAAAVLLVGTAWLHAQFVHWLLVVLACLAVGLPALLLAGFLRARRAGGALLLVLFVLPFVLIAGTNVPITLRLPTHALPLFVLLAVLVLDLRSRSQGARFPAAVAALLVALTGVVFVRHHWLHPYGLGQSSAKQGFAVEGLPGVRVDLATQRFLRDVSSSLAEAGFRRGDPVIAFDYLPGLVHFLGGTSPRYNLYMFDRPAYNCFNANLASVERPPFVILAKPMSSEQRECLETIRFPDGYRLIRTLPFPYEDIYAGFAAPGFSHVYLYAPADTTPSQAE